MLSFHENFLFIQRLFKNALKIDVEILKPPYSNKVEKDYGLRKIFWEGFNYNDHYSMSSLQQTPYNQILCLNSKLGFSNILYRVPEPFEDCLLFIGPFITETTNYNFMSRILKDNNFPIATIQAIETYYQAIPHTDEDTVIHTLQTLLAHIIPNFVPNNIETVNFSSDNEIKLATDTSFSQSFMRELYDNYVSIHNSIFEQIGQNNHEETSQSLYTYLSQIGLLHENNITRLKYMLHKFNAKCEYAVLQKKVHYFYIERTFLSFEQKIQKEYSCDRLIALHYEMIRKYGLVVRNHSLEQYSYNVRKAINYINLHLQEPLSLSYIADIIDKNSSFLSNQFKKETGKTITSFIHERRIEAAIHLFNTSELNIQEVAEQVGILELNYFSKLFKKQIGMSPSEYKKLIK